LSVQEAIDEAIGNVANAIHAKPTNILCTSGATEAINLAIKGLLPSGRKHIVTVATEHKAVLDTCSYLGDIGYRITYLPVDSEGMIDLDALTDAITEQTLLVSVMLANNETGVILPIKEIVEIAHKQ